MLKKIINFIKYNNASVFIVLAIFIVASGVFAQTETGQDIIGQKQTVINGVDNSLLLEADLDNFDMDFKIEKIEKDQKYYYVIYTYLDLVKDNNVWLYQMQEKTRKVSINIDNDLGSYLAEEMFEQYTARIAKLKKLQFEQKKSGKQNRVEVSEYNGLIGKTLQLANKFFSDYEPVKKRNLPAPAIPALSSLLNTEEQENKKIADNLTDIYNDYIAENDSDQDNVFGSLDNCPYIYNPLQEDSNGNGLGDACDLVNNDTFLDNDIATSNEMIIGADNTAFLDNKTATPTEEEVVISTEEDEESADVEEEFVDEISERESVENKEEIFQDEKNDSIEIQSEQKNSIEIAPEETVEIIELN